MGFEIAPTAKSVEDTVSFLIAFLRRLNGPFLPECRTVCHQCCSLNLLFCHRNSIVARGEKRCFRPLWIGCARRVAITNPEVRANGYRDLTMVSSWRAISSGGVPGANVTGVPIRTAIS